MGMALIDIGKMRTLVSAIENASQSLPSQQRELQLLCASVKVDGSAADQITKTIVWSRSVLVEVRRRLALAIAIEDAKPGGFRPEVVQIDESKISTLSPQEAKALAEKAAKDIKTSGVNPSDQLIDLLKKNASDPYFASALAKSLSPKEMTAVVAQMGKQQHGEPPSPSFKKKYAAFVRALGVSVATATRNHGDLALPSDYRKQWSKVITEQKGDLPLAAAAAVLLRSGGVFDKDFLDSVTTSVYDYERKRDGYRMWEDRGEGFEAPDGDNLYDPLAGLMAAMGNNPEAAQQWLAGGPIIKDGKNRGIPDRLRYLIQQRKWSADDGSGFGDALEAASVVFRENGQNGRQSATLASQAVKLFGEKIGGGKSSWIPGDHGWQIPSGMRDSVGRVLAGYMRDISRAADPAAADEMPGPNNWIFFGSDYGLPKTDIPGGVFSGADLEKVLSSVGRSKEALDPVIAAGLQLQKNSLVYALKGKSVAEIRSFLGGKNLDILSQNGPRSGKLMAFLMSNGINGATSDEAERKERREAVVDLLSGIASMPDIPDKSFVKLASAVGNDSLKDKIKKAAGFARSQGQGKASERLKEAHGGSVSDYKDALEENVKKSLEVQAYNALIARGVLDHDFGAAKAPPHSILHKDPITGKYDRLLTQAELDQAAKADPGVAGRYNVWLQSGAPSYWTNDTASAVKNYT